MDLELRRAIKAALDSSPAARNVICSIEMDEAGVTPGGKTNSVATLQWGGGKAS
jgi:hypothetical protein